MEGGRIEAQNGVRIYSCLHLKEGLVVLLGVVDELTEEGSVEGRLFTLCVEHTSL